MNTPDSAEMIEDAHRLCDLLNELDEKYGRKLVLRASDPYDCFAEAIFSLCDIDRLETAETSAVAVVVSCFSDDGTDFGWFVKPGPPLIIVPWQPDKS